MQGFILTAITAAVKCTLVLDLMLILTKSLDRKIQGHRVMVCGSRAITMQGFIPTAIIATQNS